MTKNEIKYIFKQIGITLPDSGITESVDLSSKIAYMVISKKPYFKDKNFNRFQFDMTNEFLIQTRLSQNGKLIYQLEDKTTECKNVFSFTNIQFIVPIIGG